MKLLRKTGLAYSGKVHDLTVEGTHSYNIEGVPVHNSVGGSLVAYLMDITDCDPLRFGLLFERFINPDRIDLPDADLDFMSARRHEVVDYVIQKYGKERVAGVSNFNTLGPASTIRDVGKAFGLSDREYAVSKFIPKKHGQSLSLTESADQVAEIGAYRDKNPELWDVGLKIEGCTRNMGQHAAGLVVGGVDLVERAVLERRKGDERVVCWDKRQVESMGLVKMDILGLSTLDLIDLTLKFIRKRHSKKVNLLEIPLDDPKVLANFAAGLTTGVFQFESGGMRHLLKQLGRDGNITFDDITAATALYRPGPMESGMMDSYWKRKQGDEDVEYDHPDMKPILEPTFGVMVYQEQVMQVARTIAGYTAPDADKLRKIMGKKLPEEMAKERDKFVDGCVATIACTPDWAGDLFDKIEGFAGYGFNKSHSVEYTLISYQSMYLKTNFAVEFVAAALTLMGDDKLPGLLKDAGRLGIEVELPDINQATAEFEILTDTKLMIPFARVKGLSTAAAEQIVAARGNVPFTSRADFEKRCRGRLVNIAKVEALDKIGCFSSVEPAQAPRNAPERIRDQRDLIPGLITDTVPINRDMNTDGPTKAQLVKLIARYKEEQENDGACVQPTLGKHARFMVITDGPTRGEEEVGKFSYGKQFDSMSEALVFAGLARGDGYWTGLIKRPKEGKQVSPEEIKLYAPYLDEEITLLKPPVIVLCGSIVARHFLPDLKGKASESAGKVVYDKDRDCNLVIGFSPGEIWHDPDKQKLLNEVFEVAAQLTS